MVTKLSWPDIEALLATAMNRIILIMPAIHEEWVEVIDYALNQNDKLDLKVCLDNSETVIRNGYGSEKSITSLRHNASDLRESADLRVNFICVDDTAYCLFWESRNIAGDPKGYNAVGVDISVAEKIINQFFPDPQNIEVSETPSSPFNEEKALEVKTALENNPPAQPDLQRQINVYNTHFQYAELHYEGAGLRSKSITIPKNALPFQDGELKEKISGTFNLFSKEETDNWTHVLEVQTEITRIRKDFLFPCNIKRGRSIIKKDRKNEFDKQVRELSEGLNKKMESLYEVIQKAINESRKKLKKEWIDFYEKNPSSKLNRIQNAELKREEIEKMVNDIIYKIKFPDAWDLIKKMKIDPQYSEFAIEDLSNKEFLDWFIGKGLITSQNEIVTETKAFESN